jgi:phenylalanyl-tRNA synthetase alpha chain
VSRDSHPLTGNDLLRKVKDLGRVSKTELVRGCGYVESQADGSERLNFSAFYESLLAAQRRQPTDSAATHEGKASTLGQQLQVLAGVAEGEILQASDTAELEDLRVKLLGKKGRLSAVLGAMGKLSAEQRPLVGQRANRIKERVQQQLSARLEELRSAQLRERLERERLDVTMPCALVPPGHRHPLVRTCEEIVDLFAGLGYQVSEGPEIETDHYNFTALNIPAHHPARDMQDTFYLRAGDTGEQRLLRTHTSPVQIRHLEANPPPVRIVAPGRVFRRDSIDATHSPVFHQVEVLALDEGLDFSHLRGTVTTFLRAFFGDLPVRFRASYFPFTEPSAEVDVRWRGRWLEVMGCGMVDPAVLEGLGIDSTRWSGFAAGLGVERFCMVRHGIDDIRRLYTSDLRFLEQF